MRPACGAALFDVQTDKLTQLSDELTAEGADVQPFAVDLSDAEATQIAVNAAMEHFGTPRVLIHNAALLREVSMLDVTFADWRRETNIILQAAFRCRLRTTPSR